MEQREIKKILVLPFITTLLVTALLLMIDTEFDGSLPPSEMQLMIAMALIVMASLYFFTISFVVPLYYALRKWYSNSWLMLLLFNVIGFAFIAAIDYWFITLFELQSIYFIYPLFSVLMLLRFRNNRAVNHA